MIVPNHIEEVFKQLAIKAYPLEACALLTTYKVREVKNLYTEPGRFKFDPIDYARVCNQINKCDKEKIIAIWHSHCDKEIPFLDIRTVSGADVDLHERTNTPLLISGYDGNIYYPSVNFPKLPDADLPLLGRPYIPGIYDCATLLVDRFFSAYGIVINYKFSIGYLHSNTWQGAMESTLKDNNFKLIAKTQLQEDDVLLVNTRLGRQTHGVLVQKDTNLVISQSDKSYLEETDSYLAQGYTIYRHQSLLNGTEVFI